MIQTGIIILAAGNASRMGKPKQLLSFNNKTFIQHITEEAQKTTGEAVILVLGAYADDIKPLAAKTVTHIAVNLFWKTGMAGSVKTGISELLKLYPEIENVLIAVADQPFVSAGLFREIIAAKSNSDKGIVASGYGDTIGTPVLFGKKYFPELLQLQGQEGAKKITLKHQDDITVIPFDMGAIDIDTEEDYKRFISTSESSPGFYL